MQLAFPEFPVKLFPPQRQGVDRSRPFVSLPETTAPRVAASDRLARLHSEKVAAVHHPAVGGWVDHLLEALHPDLDPDSALT